MDEDVTFTQSQSNMLQEKSTELHEVPLGRSASLSDYEVTKGTQAPPSPQQRKSLLVEAVPEDDVEIGS